MGKWLLYTERGNGSPLRVRIRTELMFQAHPPDGLPLALVPLRTSCTSCRPPEVGVAWRLPREKGRSHDGAGVIISGVYGQIWNACTLRGISGEIRKYLMWLQTGEGTALLRFLAQSFLAEYYLPITIIPYPFTFRAAKKTEKLRRSKRSCNICSSTGLPELLFVGAVEGKYFGLLFSQRGRQLMTQSDRNSSGKTRFVRRPSPRTPRNRTQA